MKNCLKKDIEINKNCLKKEKKKLVGHTLPTSENILIKVLRAEGE